MRIGLTTNYNGKGLELDANLLAAYLVELGHDPIRVQYDQPCDEKLDLNISLETVNEQLFSSARFHVIVPNLEWSGPEHARHFRRFDRIWAKTRDAERVLREKYPQVTYTGWLSRDRMDVSVRRERRFLHVGGDSGLKNTNAVIAAWRQWRYWVGELDAPLTVVSRAMHTDVVDTDGVISLINTVNLSLAQDQPGGDFYALIDSYGSRKAISFVWDATDTKKRIIQNLRVASSPKKRLL